MKPKQLRRPDVGTARGKKIKRRRGWGKPNRSVKLCYKCLDIGKK